MQFNEALGLTGKIIPENAAAQSKLTNQLGIGADSATKLRQIAEATGEDFREQTLPIRNCKCYVSTRRCCYKR